jgi:hypothetical protein
VKFRVVYDDTGEAASKVGVTGAGFLETTDEDGLVETRLPDGPYRISLVPRYGTPYLETDAEAVVSAESVKEPITLRLRPAAVVNISVVDADTGDPLSSVDVWLEQQVPGVNQAYRGVHGYGIAHYETPRSDKNGRMDVLFEPGKHRIGIALEAFPVGYEPVEPDGKQIDSAADKPVAVQFEMRKEAGERTLPRGGTSTNNEPGRP